MAHDHDFGDRRVRSGAGFLPGPGGEVRATDRHDQHSVEAEGGANWNDGTAGLSHGTPRTRRRGNGRFRSPSSRGSRPYLIREGVAQLWHSLSHTHSMSRSRDGISLDPRTRVGEIPMWLRDLEQIILS